MDREQAAKVVDALFDTCYPNLLRYAMRLVHQKSTAEEVVQDTFLDFYKALRAESQIQYPKAWTMCVARRKVFELRQEPFGIDQEHEELGDQINLTGDWSGEVDLAIDCERLRQHLNTLSVREEEVLMLRLQSMKYREIAKALGISINSVNTLLARALAKIQKELVAERPGSSQRRRANV